MGLWICITGIDGAGKTTLCRDLLKCIHGSTFMKIPYFDWVREMIALAGNNSPYGDAHTDLLLFSATNRLEMGIIKEKLTANPVLITQRCWLDNFPYRSSQRIPFDTSRKFLRPEGFLFPDIIVYLSCDYQLGYQRIKDQKGDKYEEIGFMSRLKREFDRMITGLSNGTYPIKLPKTTKIVTIDANGSTEQTRKAVTLWLESMGIQCSSGPK